MLRKAGYYTAYKGKWHLSRKFDVADQLGRLGKEMDRSDLRISTPPVT
jgi:arylsulfatase A-like enzyme